MGVPTVNNNRIWLVVGAVASVGILVMGWFLGVSPKIGEMTTANEQRTAIEQQNASLRATNDNLEKESKKIDEFKKELTELQVALPPGGDLPIFIGQLHELESASGVQLASISTSDGKPFTAVPNGTGTTVSPLVTPQNLIVIPIDMKVTGPRTNILNFVHALQFGKRLFLVNSLTIQSGSAPEEGYTGTIAGFIYVLVDPSAPPPVVTPIAPVTPSPSPTPEPGK